MLFALMGNDFQKPITNIVLKITCDRRFRVSVNCWSIPNLGFRFDTNEVLRARMKVHTQSSIFSSYFQKTVVVSNDVAWVGWALCGIRHLWEKQGFIIATISQTQAMTAPMRRTILRVVENERRNTTHLPRRRRNMCSLHVADDYNLCFFKKHATQPCQRKSGSNVCSLLFFMLRLQLTGLLFKLTRANHSNKCTVFNIELPSFQTLFTCLHETAYTLQCFGHTQELLIYLKHLACVMCSLQQPSSDNLVYQQWLLQRYKTDTAIQEHSTL